MAHWKRVVDQETTVLEVPGGMIIRSYGVAYSDTSMAMSQTFVPCSKEDRARWIIDNEVTGSFK